MPSAGLPVVSVISAARARQVSTFRLATATAAPRSAKAMLMALPNPRLPPVTMATFPVRSNRSVDGWPLVMVVTRSLRTDRRGLHTGVSPDRAGLGDGRSGTARVPGPPHGGAA